jgi:hypothetical protein
MMRSLKVPAMPAVRPATRGHCGNTRQPGIPVLPNRHALGKATLLPRLGGQSYES